MSLPHLQYIGLIVYLFSILVQSERDRNIGSKPWSTLIKVSELGSVAPPSKVKKSLAPLSIEYRVRLGRDDGVDPIHSFCHCGQ